MADEPRVCISCGESAEFTVNLVLYKLRSSPKASVSTGAVGVCSRCCQPKVGGDLYEKLCHCFGVLLFGGSNDLWRKVQELAGQGGADRKTAAGGE